LSLDPVTDEATAFALINNPNDTLSAWMMPSVSNDLVDSNGQAIAVHIYQNGHLRPLFFTTEDANYAHLMPYREGVVYDVVPVDDPHLIQGKVIAYDPDGPSEALSFTIAIAPQHGHAWANQITHPHAPAGIDHTQAYKYWQGEQGAWQYYSHKGDSYMGPD